MWFESSYNLRRPSNGVKGHYSKSGASGRAPGRSLPTTCGKDFYTKYLRIKHSVKVYIIEKRKGSGPNRMARPQGHGDARIVHRNDLLRRSAPNAGRAGAVGRGASQRRQRRGEDGRNLEDSLEMEGPHYSGYVRGWQFLSSISEDVGPERTRYGRCSSGTVTSHDRYFITGSQSPPRSRCGRPTTTR